LADVFGMDNTGQMLLIFWILIN